jgi:hypothetical protein
VMMTKEPDKNRNDEGEELRNMTVRDRWSSRNPSGGSHLLRGDVRNQNGLMNWTAW